jgi:hypothetical protein
MKISAAGGDLGLKSRGDLGAPVVMIYYPKRTFIFDKFSQASHEAFHA